VRRAALAAAVAVAAGGAACGGDPSALDPKGPAAGRIAGLWWLMFALAAAVYVLVLGLFARAVVASRREGGRRPAGDGTRLVIGGGVVLPAVVILPLAIVTMRVGDDLAARPGPADVAVEVIGNQFWWEIRYGGGGPVTANELHIPAGREVDVTLRSPDVIHSFWVPRLAGKVDLIPGQETSIRVRADEPGVYRGICAEFCGTAHARMHFLVVAETDEEFQAWLAREQADAAPPAGAQAAEGRRLFESAGCGACHTVRGTAAGGTAGPDLTHVGSRRTLAAATVDNTRPNLARFIADPQGVKPGTRMPPMPLGPEELDAVVAYVEGLR
jgi:cytochrome c oxidase subunit 2